MAFPVTIVSYILMKRSQVKARESLTEPLREIKDYGWWKNNSGKTNFSNRVSMRTRRYISFVKNNKSWHHLISILAIGLCIWLPISLYLFEYSAGNKSGFEFSEEKNYDKSSAQVVELSKPYKKSYGQRLKIRTDVQDVSLEARYKGEDRVYIIVATPLTSPPRYSLNSRVDIYINPKNPNDFRMTEDYDILTQNIVEVIFLFFGLAVYAIVFWCVVRWRKDSYKKVFGTTKH